MLSSQIHVKTEDEENHCQEYVNLLIFSQNFKKI